MKKLITAIAAIATSFGLFAADAFTTSVLSDIQSKTNNLVVGYDTTGATMLDDTGNVTVNWFADSLKTDFTTKMETYEQPELKVGEDEEGSYQYLAIDTDVGDPVLRTFKKVVEDTGVDNFKYNNIGISDHGVFIDTETTFTLFDTDPEAPGDSKILVWAKETEADDTAEPATPGSTNLMVTCGFVDGFGNVTPTNYVLNISSVLPDGLQPETMYRLTIRADKEKDSDNTEFRVYLNTHQLSTVGGLAIFPSIKAQVQELGSAGFGGTGSLKSVDLLTEADAPAQVPFAADKTYVTVTWDDKVESLKINNEELVGGGNTTTNYLITAFGQPYTMEVAYVEGYRHGTITTNDQHGVFKTLSDLDEDTVTFAVDMYQYPAITVTPELARDEAVLTVNDEEISRKVCGSLLGDILAYVNSNCDGNSEVNITLGNSASLGDIVLTAKDNLYDFTGTITIDLHGCTVRSAVAEYDVGDTWIWNGGWMTITDSVGGGALVAQENMNLIYNQIASLTIEKPTTGTISLTGKIINTCFQDDEWFHGSVSVLGGRYTEKIYTTTKDDTETDPEQEHILDGITLGQFGELKWTDEKVGDYWELEPSGAQLKVVSNPGLDVVLKIDGEVSTELQVPILTAPIEVEVTATLKDHYEFVSTEVEGWEFTDDVATYTTTIESAAESVTITAPETEAIEYTITTTGGDNATVVLDPEDGTGTFGETVEITATPDANYTYAGVTLGEGWGLDENGAATNTVTIAGDDEIVVPNATEILVTSITFDVASTNLDVGESFTLQATVLPENALDKTITWSTSAEGVATVDNGLVRAVAAGSATITATNEKSGQTATCTVAVAMPTVDITVPAQAEWPEGVTDLKIYQSADAGQTWTEVTNGKVIVGNQWKVEATVAEGKTVDNPIATDTAVAGTSIAISKEQIAGKIGKQTFTVTVPELVNFTVAVTNGETEVGTTNGVYTFDYATNVKVAFTAAIGYEITTDTSTNIASLVENVVIAAPTVALKTFTVTFKVEGQADIVSNDVAYGTAFANVKPADPVVAGKNFTGWSPEVATIDGTALEFTAQFEGQMFTLTVPPVEHTTVTVKYGDPLTIDTTNGVYTLAYGTYYLVKYTADEGYQGDQVFNGNLTENEVLSVVPVNPKKFYVQTFTNGVEYVQVTYTFGDQAISLTDPVLASDEEWDEKWYTDETYETQWTFDGTVAGNTQKAYAKITKKQTEPIPVPQKDEDVAKTLEDAGITAPEVTTVADIQALNDILKANNITDAKNGLTADQKAHMNDTFLMSEAGITKNYIYTDGAQIKIDKVEATATNGKWAFEVTVADGTTPIESAKIAAKALAGSAKKATTLGTWAAIEAADIEIAATPGAAGKVTFTVNYGNGVQGFLKIDVSKTTPVTPEP